MLIALLSVLGVAAVGFSFLLLRKAIATRAAPRLEAVVLGAVTNFFDTLGIGSFAPTMAWFKLRKLVPDQLIPATMLVGHTLPVVVQAVIFLTILGARVEPVLLTGCIVAVVAGALAGAPLVARTRVWIVQSVVGVALLIAASFYALSNLGLMPVGGSATSLPLPLMIVAIAANFVFGILLNFGIGNYAPTLAMLSLMGMDPKLSFPIMAAGACLASATAGVRHISIGKIDLRIATAITLGGIPAVLVAALVVKQMPTEVLRWLVTVVVVYAAMVIFAAAARGRQEAQQPTLEVASR
jgi:uncharacterized membrane protein YfcA